MAADHTPNELADAIADFLATEPDDPQSVDGHAVDLLERSLDALRRQGEQLDTLRAERKALLEAIGDPDELRRIAVSVARDRKVTSAEAERRIGIMTALAAAVPQDPEEGR